MSEAPKISVALPALVVVSGAASGLGTHIAGQLVDCGVATIGVDIAPQPKALSARFIATCRATYRRTRSGLPSSMKSGRRPRRVGLAHPPQSWKWARFSSLTERRSRRRWRSTSLARRSAYAPSCRYMIERGGGPIVTVASIDATFAEQQLSVYAASKGAVRQLARTVAMDHARQGVRVNVLSPGPMLAGLFERHMKSAKDPEKFHATRAARQPNGKILDPADVAKAALFLLSDASAAVNGAEVIADGGLTTSFDFRTGSEGASV